MGLYFALPYANELILKGTWIQYTPMLYIPWERKFHDLLNKIDIIDLYGKYLSLCNHRNWWHGPKNSSNLHPSFVTFFTFFTKLCINWPQIGHISNDSAPIPIIWLERLGYFKEYIQNRRKFRYFVLSNCTWTKICQKSAS